LSALAVYRVKMSVPAANIDHPAGDSRGRPDWPFRFEFPFLLTGLAVYSIEMTIMAAKIDDPFSYGRGRVDVGRTSTFGRR
jgi:hypothetical protein